MFSDLYSFIRFVIRSHWRRPGFALVIILTLTLGLGATVASSSLVVNTLFNPLPFKDSDELVMVVSAQPARNAFRLSVSYPDFKDWQRLNSVFSEMAAVSDARPVTWTGADRAEHLEAEFVSWNYFPMLGVGTVAGRSFEAEEDLTEKSHPVVVISHSLWQRRFDADEAVIGETLDLNGLPHTVIGVLDPVYKGIWWDHIDIWLPMAMAPHFVGENHLQDRSIHWHLTMGRLKPGVTQAQAAEAMNSVAEELENRHPVTNKGYRVSVFDQRELYYVHIEDQLWKTLLFSGVFLVLCYFNIISLMITRGTVRRQEVAVRSALGAGRRRLLLEQALESLLLASIGGFLGLSLSRLTGPLLRSGEVPPASFDFQLVDFRVYAVATALVLVTAVFIGLGPAVQTLWSDLWRFLKQGAVVSGSKRFRTFLDILVVVEVALASVVMISAVSTVKSSLTLIEGDLGMDQEHLLTMKIDLQDSRYQELSALHADQLELVDFVEQQPGVRSVGLVGPHAPPQVRLYTDITFEDRLEESTEGASMRVYRQSVSPGYLQAIGIPLLEGREFSNRDDPNSPRVVIISKLLADLIWPGESPLGKRLRRGLPDNTEHPWLTVVGVAQTTANRSLKDLLKGPDYDVYMPLLQDEVRSPTLLVRSEGDPGELAGVVRDAVEEFNSNIPVYNVKTMREHLAYIASEELFLANLMTLFGIIAAVVIAVGLYGVLAYSVRQRVREFGTRIALGASTGRILWMVLRRGLLILGTGAFLGLTASLILDSRDLLPGVKTEGGAVGVEVLAIALACLVAVGIVGILGPAWRATQVEPTQVLKQE
ncbi:MAG: ABC transporter permease [Acidobacteriota bacterium]|nr:ABC transporter permease [Acidobacteriota bacterium]